MMGKSQGIAKERIKEEGMKRESQEGKRLEREEWEAGEREQGREMGRAQREKHMLLAAACMLCTILPCLSVYTGGECYFNAKAECYQCVCLEPFGVGCCEHGSQPVDYPDWCEVVRKPDSCNVAVVMRANHKLPCLYGGRGRMRPSWKSDNDPLF
ncbi:hypothetical protein JZ751_000136 [Albula glossodonta]|uniref:Uncharacterized protein n=1 Tax=Albula glossodonta TaxID=121402 RepID=A0A8T2PVJ5_9TELE|nr:hypothetical protein JZ751_000136 [Albula glossodonta]